MNGDEERIALFLDYENLAIGAREHLGSQPFDLKPIADALAERGRVIVRRAYGDWGKFHEDGRMLTRHHVELIEIPQRMGSVRKNAADIKMAVDAVELCFERDYITTYVLGTGDSDFTPLVHKLRELNRRVIGLGIQSSTSALLPPACDEFLFYERLEGVELRKRRSSGGRGSRSRGRRPVTTGSDAVDANHDVADTVDAHDGMDAIGSAEAADSSDGEFAAAATTATVEDAERLITQTLSGLERTGGGPVRASSLKRAVLRKDSTFNEADFGFRGFTELLRNLAERGVVSLSDTAALGDPEVLFPSESGEDDHVFDLLVQVVGNLATRTGGTPLSGLKTQLRRLQPDFSEKRFGYGGFLQFAKAAAARGAVAMAWDDDADDYILRPTGQSGAAAPSPAPAAPASANGTASATGANTTAAAGTVPAPAGRSGAGPRSRRRDGRGDRSDEAATAEAPAEAPAEAHTGAPAEAHTGAPADVAAMPAAGARRAEAPGTAAGEHADQPDEPAAVAASQPAADVAGGPDLASPPAEQQEQADTTLPEVAAAAPETPAPRPRATRTRRTTKASADTAAADAAPGAADSTATATAADAATDVAVGAAGATAADPGAAEEAPIRTRRRSTRAAGTTPRAAGTATPRATGGARASAAKTAPATEPAAPPSGA